MCRAEETLKQADKMDCNEFVSPYDIVHGIEKVKRLLDVRKLNFEFNVNTLTL